MNTLYLITEFQRLKDEEQKQLGWTAKRELTKLNYPIHTDAIRHNVIPQELSSTQTSIIYANEADVNKITVPQHEVWYHALQPRGRLINQSFSLLSRKDHFHDIGFLQPVPFSFVFGFQQVRDYQGQDAKQGED